MSTSNSTSYVTNSTANGTFSGISSGTSNATDTTDYTYQYENDGHILSYSLEAAILFITAIYTYQRYQTHGKPRALLLLCITAAAILTNDLAHVLFYVSGLTPGSGLPYHAAHISLDVTLLAALDVYIFAVVSRLQAFAYFILNWKVLKYGWISAIAVLHVWYPFSYYWFFFGNGLDNFITFWLPFYVIITVCNFHIDYLIIRSFRKSYSSIFDNPVFHDNYMREMYLCVGSSLGFLLIGLTATGLQMVPFQSLEAFLIIAVFSLPFRSLHLVMQIMFQIVVSRVMHTDPNVKDIGKDSTASLNRPTPRITTVPI